MFELIIIWDSGEKEVYTYSTKEEAESIENGYKIAFGSQVWTAINERR